MENKRTRDLFDYNISGDKLCKICLKNIPLYQINHYFKNYGINISFCRLNFYIIIEIF